MTTPIPRYIVWSTDKLDPDDHFQAHWLLRQILLHGRMEDVRALDLDTVERELDSLNLPDDISSLWKRFLEFRHVKQ